MSQEKINHTEDEISLKELVLKIKDWYQFLLSKWITILFAGIIGGALGLCYAIFKKPVYTAETTFVLEEGESGGGLGQYAGLASMVGVDIGGGGGGIFKGDNILELYKSRTMIRQTLLTLDTFDKKQQLLIERYIEFNGLRETWRKNSNLKNINFSDKNAYIRVQDSVIGAFVEIINNGMLNVTKPDKKLSIISVKFESKDELFAKSFTNNIVSKVNTFYVKTKTKKSSENLSILQTQADSVKKALNTDIGGVAKAVDANLNLNAALQRLRIGSQKKQVDVQANIAVYEEILKNLELAKINFRNQKPLLQIIDEPVFPLKVKKISKLIAIILGSVVLCIFTCAYLVFSKLYLTKTSDQPKLS
jgi:hypothetical protein